VTPPRRRPETRRPATPRPATRPARPTAADLVAAADRTIPDVVGPGLRVLFSGINPSLYSAATGHHFARPGNRFWPALHRSGFTPRLFRPGEGDRLPALGLGITNVVARATARADELSADELVAGGEILAATVARWRPAWLAVVGVTAYRVAFGRPRAAMGRQPDLVGGRPVWVLPNPSGLNAHYTVDTLAAAFGDLRRVAAESPPQSSSG
jgi:TDG/mug DNA glycosylase family protein